ncbi:MAG: CoA transferase [Burkholderiales bacterium]|nr:CoA transferase [Burkholderiales bacterium]
MAGHLTGVRVLDLSRVLAGPWAAQILADYGADVIKVERPQGGDDTRKFGPPWIHDRDSGEIVDAAYYASCNRGKRSVAIDIARTEGQAIVRRLAGQSDIVLENYKVGALAKYGLDYSSLRSVNPRIIYCSITGFGQTGPYRNRPGYDFLIQGMGGLMSVTGERDDRPGGGPQRAGVALADILTGMYATSAVLAALYRRENTGQGEYIDLALLDAQVATLANQGMNYLIGGSAPRRMGNGHPNIVPYQAFATADSHIILAVGNDEQFVRFCGVAGCPELAIDSRYTTIATRNAHRDELLGRLEQIIRQRTSGDWIEALEKANVPCGPINTIDKVFDDPQVRARGMRLDLPHPRAGLLPSIANPVRFASAPIEYTHAPPTLGQHTDEVLGELAELDAAQLAKLREDGVIG